MLRTETYDIQAALAAYCRTGKLTPIEGAKEERLPEYRRLVYNVVKGFLDQAFPITQQHLSEDQWEKLCEDFFDEHKCQPAEAWRIPQELVTFITENKHPLEDTFPFLRELLHFEWLEIDIYNLMDQTDIHLDNGMLLNPHFIIEQFTYPVHQPLNDETKPNQYFLLVYRHPVELNARFMELAPLSAFLLETLASNGSISNTVNELATALKMEASPQLKQQANQFLSLLQEKGMIYT